MLSTSVPIYAFQIVQIKATVPNFKTNNQKTKNKNEIKEIRVKIMSNKNISLNIQMNT